MRNSFLFDPRKDIDIDKPATRVSYDLDEIGEPNLATILGEFAREHGLV